MQDRAFDKQHGVCTAVDAAVDTVGPTPAPLGEDTGLYRPIWGSIFHPALEALPIDHREFTFIDLGSARGKALLLASDYPWKRIIGVERSRALHHAALENIRSYRSPRQKCVDIEAVHGDARKLELPNEPLVVFFFNPFAPAVLREVLETVADSVAMNPRPVYVVSVTVQSAAEAEEVFRQWPAFQLLEGTTHHLVYRVEAEVSDSEWDPSRLDRARA
jgi:hypothetical protein